MQEVITRYKRKERVHQTAAVLRALSVWREKIGKKLTRWNEVKTIRNWREKGT